ncbi:MAG: M48 family metallopeptidase [Spirosomataceae bacterium]
MKNTIFSFLSACLLVGIIWACQQVPLTGRKQFVGLISQDQIMALSFAEYKGFLDTSKVLPASNANAAMIARVGSRLKTAAETYLIQNNYSEAINGYQWEFRLVEDKTVNAWCMPGGKVVFYTGILPICLNETGVAVVMGHEIAHAIANHGRERMSRAMAAQGITQIGAVATGVITQNEQLMNLAGQVFGIGTQLGGVLPNSRMQESEADKLGLIFMALAGYNLDESVGFWERMAKAGEGSQKPPRLLSTHPADSERIANLKKLIPQVRQHYATIQK